MVGCFRGVAKIVFKCFVSEAHIWVIQELYLSVRPVAPGDVSGLLGSPGLPTHICAVIVLEESGDPLSPELLPVSRRKEDKHGRSKYITQSPGWGWRIHGHRGYADAVPLTRRGL